MKKIKKVSFKKNNINEVHYCDPVDYTITKRLDHSIKSLSIKSYKYDTPAFMLQESDVFDHFTNKKSHFMAICGKKMKKNFIFMKSYRIFFVYKK